MANDRAPFLSLTADVDDTRIEDLARSKGVGTYDKPIKPQRATEMEPDKMVSQEARAGATPRSRMKTVNLELPDYVWTELKILAVQQQTSLRHVVMAALKKAGIVIADVDMVEDGRRNR